MQLERTIHIRVGIFVTAGLVLAMLAVFMIGSSRSWFEHKYHLYSTFDNISGIGPGAAVSLAGMRVGSVVAIRFPNDLQKKTIVVDYEIHQEFQDRIRTDSAASIVTQGLLGDKMITVTVGGADAEPLQDGDELRTTLAGDLFSIGKGASDLMAEVRNVVRSVEELVRDAKDGTGALHALIYDQSGDELVKNLNVGARSFRQFMGRAANEGDLSTVLANLEEASKDVRNITGQIQRGEGTLGALLTDEDIYNDVRSIFGRANRNVLLKSVVRSMLRAKEGAVQRP